MGNDQPEDDSIESQPDSTRKGKAINRFRYADMRRIDDALATLIRRLGEGFCEYIDPVMTDETASLAVARATGMEVTAGNIRGIRLSAYGNLRHRVAGARPDGNRALTPRVAKLEEDLASLLEKVTSQTSAIALAQAQAAPHESQATTASPVPALSVRLSRLEAGVEAMKSKAIALAQAQATQDASREQLFAEAVGRINHLEGRLDELVKAVSALAGLDNGSVESRLGSKYRITRRDPRKR